METPSHLWFSGQRAAAYRFLLSSIQPTRNPLLKSGPAVAFACTTLGLIEAGTSGFKVANFPFREHGQSEWFSKA